MKTKNTGSLKNLVAAGIMITLVSCGAEDRGRDAPRNSNQTSPEMNKAEEQSLRDQKEKSVQLGMINDGKYYLSTGTFEGSDSLGNKIDKQTLQIAGDYYWETKHQGDEQFEVIATGNAKLSSNNTVLAELNCTGSQDVYSFAVVSSGSLRNFAQLEAGCPQAAQLNSAQQMSIRSLNDDAFQYTVVSQSDGVRTVETYVFRK